MNGRIYDPTLGRFLQADPHIQAPMNSQNYNRYSYVLNNPMSYTDPSGYFFKKLFKTIKKHWRTIVAVGIAAAGGWYALTAMKAEAVGAAYGYAAASGFASGFVSTGSLRGALTGALTSMAFMGVGQATMGAHGAIKALAHGMAGGIISDLQGGKFGHGFISAGLTKGAQVAGMISDKLIQGVLQSAILGGTISKITGGKFANGAVTSAFQFAMNKFVTDGMKRGGLEYKKRVDVQDPVVQEPELVSIKRQRVYAKWLGDPPPGMKLLAEAGWRVFDSAAYGAYDVEYITTSSETTQDTVTTQWMEDSSGNVSRVGQRVETQVLSTDYNTTINIQRAGIVGYFRMPDNPKIVHPMCIQTSMKGC